MVPFMVTTPFVGFAAKALGGVDYSIFIGLPVTGLLYLAVCRNLDLANERRIVEQEGLVKGVHPSN
jgi:nucleobase:cation symporter-1, NCS1 family